VGRAWPLAEADELVGGLLDTETLAEGGGQQQPGVGDGVGVVKAMSSSSRVWEDGIEKVPFCRGRMVVSATPSSQLRGPFSSPDHGQTNSRSVDSGLAIRLR
jgi:hypothetical protein